jgi:hypothetical protein
MQTLETILTLSAEHIAGAGTPGKARGDVRWHGSQPGKIQLADRLIKVKRPRLRHKTECGFCFHFVKRKSGGCRGPKKSQAV